LGKTQTTIMSSISRTVRSRG